MNATEELLGRRVRLQQDRDYPLPSGTHEGQAVVIMRYQPRRGIVTVVDRFGQEWELRAANLEEMT